MACSSRLLTGFEDPKHPDKVFRLDKALYDLKQDPRAWYDTLKELLMKKGFKPGSLDPTLFTMNRLLLLFPAFSRTLLQHFLMRPLFLIMV